MSLERSPFEKACDQVFLALRSFLEDGILSAAEIPIKQSKQEVGRPRSSIGLIFSLTRE